MTHSFPRRFIEHVVKRNVCFSRDVPRGTGSGRLNMRGHVSPRFIVVGTTTVEEARWSDIKSPRLVNDI